jgi:hypothetical protein
MISSMQWVYRQRLHCDEVKTAWLCLVIAGRNTLLLLLLFL